MADEDDVRQVQLAADRQHVVCIAIERGVCCPVEGRGIGLPMPDMIEEDDLVPVLEGRRDEPPHVLVAAVAVGEDHGLLALRPRTLTLFRSRTADMGAPCNPRTDK